jgi:hypothetical protein
MNLFKKNFLFSVLFFMIAFIEDGFSKEFNSNPVLQEQDVIKCLESQSLPAINVALQKAGMKIGKLNLYNVNYSSFWGDLKKGTAYSRNDKLSVSANWVSFPNKLNSIKHKLTGEIEVFLSFNFVKDYRDNGPASYVSVDDCSLVKLTAHYDERRTSFISLSNDHHHNNVIENPLH